MPAGLAISWSISIVSTLNHIKNIIKNTHFFYTFKLPIFAYSFKLHRHDMLIIPKSKDFGDEPVQYFLHYYFVLIFD